MLILPLVEDLIDKQSVPNARSHFSIDVERWMRNNGYGTEADFTALVRDWYEASDSPGMSATERIKKLLAMRTFLLSDVKFNFFPPETRNFKGIPSVTFEGMLIYIDTKLQMYGMTSSFNMRSISSLAAETTVGVLHAMYPTPQVSIKARDVPSLISNAVDIMTCKSNPKRGFSMRTSRKSGVYPCHEGDQRDTDACMESPTSVEKNSCIVPRNNDFDDVNRRNSTRQIKFGSIFGTRDLSRGALPVRQFHRKDESKILPTKRLGINLQD